MAFGHINTYHPIFKLTVILKNTLYAILIYLITRTLNIILHIIFNTTYVILFKIRQSVMNQDVILQRPQKTAYSAFL